MFTIWNEEQLLVCLRLGTPLIYLTSKPRLCSAPPASNIGSSSTPPPPHPAPSPPFHPPAAGAVMGGGCRLGQQIEPLARGVWGGMAPFPSLKLFNVGSTLPAFIGLSHLYSKIPSLSELVEPTSRFYWSFSSALGRWFRGWRPPKINTTGELGLGRAGGTSPGLPSPLRLLPSTLRPSLTFKSCCIHMPFNTQIHKYTNTQCFAVMSTFVLYLSVCLVFRICIDCICISCTFDLLSFNPFGMFVFLEIRPKRQHSSQ